MKRIVPLFFLERRKGMLNTEDIRNKEVINIYDGKSMGFVCDIEINLKEGRIDGIVLPGDKSFMKIFGKRNERLRYKMETCQNRRRRCHSRRCSSYHRLKDSENEVL